MFEFTTHVDNGTPEGVDVVMKFKPYGDVPGRISRHNIGRIEAQVWAALEWGLVEPKHWPLDSHHPGTDVFDVMPQRDITRCYNAWQDEDEKDK
jgi:hypothetical protein